VEYVMTASGLERVDKMSNRDDDENNNDGNEVLEQYRKSREELEKERIQKQKELDDLNRELQKPVDTIRRRDSARYKYSQASVVKPTAAVVAKADEHNPSPALHNVIMMAYAF